MSIGPACRAVACAAGAALITLALCLAFVQTNSIRLGAQPGTPGSGASELHGWVGQPEPAVLVD
jgi:hypothetical protein